MDKLQACSPWGGPVGFFEEFCELSQQKRFARNSLPGCFVEMSNPVCGDEVKVYVEVCQGRIVDYGYRQRGCWPVVGCLELWGHLLTELSLEELKDVQVTDLMKLITGVPSSKRHAFSLTLRAVQLAALQAGVSDAG